MVSAIPLENMFLILAVRLNAERANELVLNINLKFTDDKPTLLTVENSVLHGFAGRQHEEPDASLTLSSLNFKLLMAGQKPPATLIDYGEMQIDGDIKTLAKMVSLFDQFDRRFPIVTPRPDWD